MVLNLRSRAVDSEFWIKSWKEGRTNFNQAKFHDKLTEYFPQLLPRKGQKVLVPLCGKSIDLLWLQELSLDVHGVELYDKAVESFFAENGLLPPEITHDQNFSHYAYKNIVISCGDFFGLKADSAYDFIYDRASLVALPPPMRKDYARVIKQSLKKGGKYLLIVYHYDPSKMEGPPFSIHEDEIHELYADQFRIQCVESKKPENEGPRLTTVESLKQNIYILEKIK